MNALNEKKEGVTEGVNVDWWDMKKEKVSERNKDKREKMKKKTIRKH